MSEKYALIENEKIAENISLIIDYFREVYMDKNIDKGLPQESVEKFKEWVNYLEKLNSDYEDIIADYYNEKNKAYIFLSGHEDEKIYIDGDTCYEVSDQIPGSFTFDEAQKIIKLTFGKGWRLPYINELNLIYKNLKLAGQILDEEWYWSLTYSNEDEAQVLDFGEDAQGGFSKKYQCRARAIRPFRKGV